MAAERSLQMQNFIIVKELKVLVEDKTLSFQIAENTIILDRQLGLSDYRIVYNYLKLKNPSKAKGAYTVGNFTYNIDSYGLVDIVSTNFKFFAAFTFEMAVENAHQKLRNAVIKFLLENID